MIIGLLLILVGTVSFLVYFWKDRSVRAFGTASQKFASEHPLSAESGLGVSMRTNLREASEKDDEFHVVHLVPSGTTKQGYGNWSGEFSNGMMIVAKVKDHTVPIASAIQLGLKSPTLVIPRSQHKAQRHDDATYLEGSTRVIN